MIKSIILIMILIGTIHAQEIKTTNKNPIEFKIGFANFVTGLTAAKILTNGVSTKTLTGLENIYTLSCVPAKQGLITCQIPAGIAVDDNGIPNKASNVYAINYDSVAPTVLSVSSFSQNTTFDEDCTIPLVVNFSEPVSFINQPKLLMSTGNYAIGSGGNHTKSLIFVYTVQKSDVSADLDYASSNALEGTIVDIAGNIANLVLPKPGTVGSLGYEKNIKIQKLTSFIVLKE